jgi:hypothetical protein
MNRAAVLFLALIFVSVGASLACADIPVPDPPSVWSRGREPSSNTLVATGAALSAVIVAAGLAIGRWPVKSVVGRIVVAVVAVIALGGVWGIAAGAISQAERDRAMWKQWETDEANRQSRWRPPPFDRPPDLPPPESAPQPAESASGGAESLPAEPAPTTAEAESVQ